MAKVIAEWLNVVIVLYSGVREGVSEISAELKVTGQRTIGKRCKQRTFPIQSAKERPT